MARSSQDPDAQEIDPVETLPWSCMHTSVRRMIERVPAPATNTLLLVDDNPRNLLALGALLEPSGHRLVTADGGRSAIDTFEREEPDLVLCDFAMPECDGIEVLRAIRAHPFHGDTPVVIVTA